MFRVLALVAVGAMSVIAIKKIKEYQINKEEELWYAGRPGDTTSMTARPGFIPPGAMFEPGYTPAVTEW